LQRSRGVGEVLKFCHNKSVSYKGVTRWYPHKPYPALEFLKLLIKIIPVLKFIICFIKVKCRLCVFDGVMRVCLDNRIRHLHLDAACVAACGRARGEARRTLELHFTYDEEVGGIVGPKWLLDEKLTRPDAVIAAGFSYAVVHRPRWLPASGGDGHGQAGRTPPCRTPASTHWKRRTAILTALYAHRTGLAQTRSKTSGIVSPTLNVRADQGRHHNQCGAGPDRLSHRPPHDPGGESGQGGRPSCASSSPHRSKFLRRSSSTCTASCWPSRSSRSQARTG